MELHVHPGSAKGDTFHLQTETLLRGVFSGQFDSAA
jgi:hypothetical protein